MKWVDNHKGVFSVSIQAVSTIHTQVRMLNCFTFHFAQHYTPYSHIDNEYVVGICYSTLFKFKLIIKGECSAQT